MKKSDTIVFQYPELDKSLLEPFKEDEIPHINGIPLIQGTLCHKNSKLVSILAMDLNPDKTNHVMVMDFSYDTKYTPKPEWVSNEKLFRKYLITFDGVEFHYIGKLKVS